MAVQELVAVLEFSQVFLLHRLVGTDILSHIL